MGRTDQFVTNKPLRGGGYEVPRNEALLKSIGTKKKPLIEKSEKAYIMQLCATPSGVDMLTIVNGVCAHWQQPVDLSRIKDHVWQLTQRGIIERHGGNYRVRPEVILKLRDMIKDDQNSGTLIRTK